MSVSRSPPTPVDDVTVVIGAESVELGSAPWWSTGRYLAVERIGRGGMGEVILAYDPKLKREVALKSVRADALDDVAQARLLREAQAMARLTHPNVVAVFDAETHDGGVVIVMEYVAGPTLREWSSRPRSWRDIVMAFVAAGRGLFAAHRAGVVHRDFKPSNVLKRASPSGIAAAEHFKVTDFGLARRRGDADLDEGGFSDGSSAEAATGDPTLTGGGIVVGTPKYMAPEQHAGDEATAAADQFAFCVSLWEALCGEAPYGGRDYLQLVAAKDRGPPAWPRVPGVPRSIGHALRRGLSPSASSRWPDLECLLDELERTTRPRAVRLAAAGLGVGVIGIVAAVASWRASASATCDGGSTRVAEVWNDERATEIGAAMSATGLPFADASWSRARAVLDDYAARWVGQHDETCRATHMRGEQSPAVLDLRMACLERARSELRETVDAFALADLTVTENMIRTVSGLPSLARCERDAVALASDVGVPDDPTVAGEVERLRGLVDGVRVATRSGRYDDAAERLRQIADEAEATGFAPLVAEHAALSGRVAHDLARYDEAHAFFTDAIREALAHGDDRRAAEAAIGQGHLVGITLRRHGEGRVTLEFALGLARAAGDQAAEVDAHYLLAGIASYESKLPEAELEVRAALELADRAPEFDESRAVWFHSLLARLLFLRGAYPEAEAEVRVLEEECVRIFGEDHPNLALAWSSLGGVLTQQGRNDEAEKYLRRAIALYEAAYGPRHAGTMSARGNLAGALHLMGRNGEAEVEYRTSLAIAIELLGPEHTQIGAIRYSLGDVLNALHRGDEAEAEYRAAVDLLGRTLAPEHQQLATARHNLGAFLRTHARSREALPLLEASWSAREGDDTPPEDIAETAYELARALHDTAGDAERAAALLARARQVCPADSELFGPRCREIDGWAARR